MDALSKRNAAMAETQRLIALAKPLKEKAEAVLARGGTVSNARWRRLARLSAQIQTALDLAHCYNAEWRQQNENK